MSVLLDKSTGVLIYGLTGRYALLQSMIMKSYGTHILAGIVPGRGGEEINEIPLYDTISEALAEQPATAIIIYAPAPYVLECFHEAVDQGLKLIMIGSEGVPVRDGLIIRRRSEEENIWVIGPNSLGLIAPGIILLGSMAKDYARPGGIGLISRSGTLSIMTFKALFDAGLGLSTAVSIGGDLITGRSQVDWLNLLEGDKDTDAVVMLTEIGGTMEYPAAETIRKMKKRVVAMVVGRTAPWGKTMGHSGAVIYNESETAQAKERMLIEAGAFIARTPWEIPEFIKAL